LARAGHLDLRREIGAARGGRLAADEQEDAVADDERFALGDGELVEVLILAQVVDGVATAGQAFDEEPAVTPLQLGVQPGDPPIQVSRARSLSMGAMVCRRSFWTTATQPICGSRRA